MPNEGRAKLQKPGPSGLIGYIQTALCEQVLNLPIAQSEASIKSDGMEDNILRGTVVLEGIVVHPRMVLQGRIQKPVQ